MGSLKSCFCIIAVFVGLPVLVAANDAEVAVVTYGSTVKLEHKATTYRLHSHDVSYGTGSGQQSVTGHHDHGDANSFWIIKNAHQAQPILSGTPVQCGDTIRLQHLRTRKNLHSHDHRAPMNRDNEVSAYGHVSGRWTDGDEGDNWLVDCMRGKGEWQRGADLRFRHVTTGTYLTASGSLRFGDPIPNQLQVSGNNRKNGNTIWRTNEGVYLAPPKEKA